MPKITRACCALLAAVERAIFLQQSWGETQIFMNNPRNWWSMDPSASRKISRTVRWLWGLSSWLSNSDSTVSTFSSVCALRLLLPRRLSTVPIFTSSLLMLFFVHFLFRNKLPSAVTFAFIRTSKFCLLCWTASKLAHLFWHSIKISVIFGSGLKWGLHEIEACKLYFRVFLNISAK